MSSAIPADDLIVGDIYVVNGRNFRVGVYIGPGPSDTIGALDERFARFRGIRDKFGYKYLVNEMAVPLRRLGRAKAADDDYLRRALPQYQARAGGAL